jgi:AhpD family alkylhydroperoxidase
MDNRIKELIAVGASVTANCQPCLKYHVAKAQENGAGEQDVLEAIAVAKMVRKGAMGKMDKFMSTLFENAPAGGDSAGEGCG